MSDFSDIYDDEDETPVQEQGGPKALREAYAAEKAKREALEQRLAALETDTRQSKLADALKASGVDPRVAGLVPQDVTPDKLGDWLGQWGEVLGVKKTEEATPSVSADDAAAIAAVSGEPTGTTSSATQHTAETIGGIDSEDDFAKAMGWRR